MQATEIYYLSKTTTKPFDDTLQTVIEKLKAQGFGVLTDIDVKETLHKKLNVEFRPYRILGACNPDLAYKGLQVEANLGVLLPCNVVVQEKENGQVEVSTVNPIISMQAVHNAQLEPIAKEVQARLQTVLNGI